MPQPDRKHWWDRLPWVTGDIPFGWDAKTWALMWTVRYALALVIVLSVLAALLLYAKGG